MATHKYIYIYIMTLHHNIYIMTLHHLHALCLLRVFFLMYCKHNALFVYYSNDYHPLKISLV